MTDREIVAAIKALDEKSEEEGAKSHAVYGASTSERWTECSGSIALSATVPKRPSGPHALEGSRAHLCLEIFLKLSDAPLSARKRLYKFFPTDMVDHCFNALTHLLDSTPEGAIRYSEQKVDSSHFTMPGQFGTVDCAIVEEFGKLQVVDFKYGAGVVVEPEGNTQMIYYALAISKQFDHNFSEVELKIIQPRAYHEKGPIRSHVMSMGELLKWEDTFRLAVRRAEGKNPALSSGPWCRWCDAKVVCPEIGREKVREAGFDFDEIPTGVPPVGEMASDKLSKLLKAFPFVEMYMEAVREYAFHLLDGGGEIPGFKLVEKQSTRKWAGPEIVAEAKKTWGPLAFSPPELLSPAQMEKVLGIEFDEKKVKAWIEKRVTKQSSGLTLVPESDKRPAMSSIDKDFSCIPQEKKRRGNDDDRSKRQKS